MKSHFPVLFRIINTFWRLLKGNSPPMLSDISVVLDEIEVRASSLSSDDILHDLRKLCLDEFGELLLNMPDSRYPRISSALPKMASDEVQTVWTGAAGYVILRQSVTFVRVLWHAYERHAKKNLSDARILDYGCGYGRLLRLMMYFANNGQLFGCDPWERSIELCREDGIQCDLKITDYLPSTLPYPEASFDLIYAFSVFTHTSARATGAALQTLSKVIKKDGLLAITIRPIEYWDFHQGLSDVQRNTLKHIHKEVGFSFAPHNRQSVDGDITYGDTSMSLSYIESNYPCWKIVGSERTLDDPYQRIVYLQLK